MTQAIRKTLVCCVLTASLCTTPLVHGGIYDIQENAPAVGGAAPVPELYVGESDDVGPQVALEEKPARLHLEAMLDSQYYHTSNLFLTEDAPSYGLEEKGSEVLLTSVELAGATDPVAMGEGDFQPRFGYRHQWYDFNSSEESSFPRYDSNDFDFYVQTLFMEARYRYRKQWIFEGGFDWTQLSYTTGNSDFYSEVVPHLGVRRLIPLDDTRVITAGYQLDYHATDAEPPYSGIPSNINDRTSHGVFVNYTQSFTPQLILQPYYRFQFTDYSHYASFVPVSRTDYLHTVGASLTYYFLPEISVRGFASYDVNDSTAKDNIGPVYDYKKLDAGIGANLNYRF